MISAVSWIAKEPRRGAQKSIAVLKDGRGRSLYIEKVVKKKGKEAELYSRVYGAPAGWVCGEQPKARQAHFLSVFGVAQLTEFVFAHTEGENAWKNVRKINKSGKEAEKIELKAKK